MKRSTALPSLMAVGLMTMTAAAYWKPQAPLPPQALKVTQIEKVTDRLFVITGSDRSPQEAFSGGNTAVFITDTGVVLVDTKLPGWGQVILDRVRTVTDKPVTTIINTHTHLDHTGSNSFFNTSVDIVAHENTKANMARMTAFRENGGRGLPRTTFRDKMSIGADRDRIDLYYFGRGHTNGDAWVVFPTLRVMHAGDMFARKDAPTLDLANGGSGLEFAGTLARAVAALGQIDTVIGGHGPLRTMAELQEYQRFMTDFVAAVREAKKAGRSVDEAAASIDLSGRYNAYTSERYKGAVAAIYEELKK